MEEKAQRRKMRYTRRHQEASHDAAAWLMMTLFWARSQHHNIGPEMPIPFDSPMSFQGVPQRNLFRRAPAITPDHIEVFRPEYAAVCRILQAKAAGESFSESDLGMVAQALNYRVSLRGSHDDHFGFGIDEDKSYERLAAELLLRYLDSLNWSHVPQSIGACDSCNGLFLRLKANQTACSTACRMRTLKESGYWSPENRKRQRQIRQKSKSRSEKSEKLRGIIREKRGKKGKG